MKKSQINQDNCDYHTSGSPAVHILPGPVGDFLLDRKAFNKLPVFFLNVSKEHRLSILMARKKCPSGIGLGLPVSLSIPQTSSPKGPD